MTSRVNRNSVRMVSSLVLGLVAATFGCSSSSDGTGDVTAVGGVGGTLTSVGGTIAGTGTIASVGGSTVTLTTIATNAGGSTATGTDTSVAQGGSVEATGGSDGTGSTSSATGGSSLGAGGSSVTAGGTSSTGGKSATGGKSSTGGTTATGGKSSTGGTTATGGKSSTGGTSSTGTYDTLTSTGEFSFFVTSLSFLKSKAPSLSCDSSGKLCSGALGGNLGGLDGADALCTAAAKAANPGDNHQWRAYLSTSTVNAKDRIGTGPWYSAPPAQYYASSGATATKKTNYASEGLLFGTSATIYTNNRPGDSTTLVWYGTSQSGGGGTANYYPFNQCYLDEFGMCVQSYGDSHDIMTGTTAAGLKNTNNCSGWTSNATSSTVDLGHSWPRQFGSVGSDMNWARSGENHPCAGTINLTTNNNPASPYSNGVGSGGGYGSFYCFAYITGSE